ncbi:MAG: class I SAM-dependent methyltransferase [Candidatus Paceibacterota bacterium]|jgi:SAM-dependent methyltransferase
MNKNPLGKLTTCQICGSKELIDIVNLDHQPPCDVLLNAKEIKEEEIHYPINVVRCVKCGLVQLDFIPPPQVVFHKKYPYRTGITQMLVDNFKELAEATVARLKLPKGSLIVDIGSNDGTALQPFKEKGMRVLGIEPTDVARIAIKQGIPTINDFFTKEIAKQIVKKHGTASLVIATNVFAHINNLSSFVEGVYTLLKPGGVFISESQYLLDTIQKVQYDTMYHEHLRFYSLKPLSLLFEKFGFTLTDAERISSSGGSIRVFATKGKNLSQSPHIASLIQAEEKAGLYKQPTYINFKKRIETSRLKLVKFLSELKLKEKTIAGVGSPGRSSPILNYCHIDSLLIPYLAEQSSSLKLGLHSPGTHIPIIDEKQLFIDQPDYVLLFSWHIADTIIKKLRKKGLRSKFIIPLPEVKIISK